MPVAQDINYKEEMITKYMPLVKYIASRVIIGKTKHIEFEDLVSFGVVGLIDALNKFDASKGIKFSSYASIRVKGAMIDELRKNSPISKGAMDKLTTYNKAVEALNAKLMREPTDDEIAKEIGGTLKDIRDVEGYISYLSQVSLENLIYSDDDEMQVMDKLEDKNILGPEQSLEDKEKVEYLYKAIELLKEKDQIVLNLYYKEGFTLKEIGKVLEVSESRVCQLHTRALTHLRNNFKKLKYT